MLFWMRRSVFRFIAHREVPCLPLSYRTYSYHCSQGQGISSAQIHSSVPKKSMRLRHNYPHTTKDERFSCILFLRRPSENARSARAVRCEAPKGRALSNGSASGWHSFGPIAVRTATRSSGVSTVLITPHAIVLVWPLRAANFGAAPRMAKES